jgi:hypothetical protein
MKDPSVSVSVSDSYPLIRVRIYYSYYIRGSVFSIVEIRNSSIPKPREKAAMAAASTPATGGAADASAEVTRPTAELDSMRVRAAEVASFGEHPYEEGDRLSSEQQEVY